MRLFLYLIVWVTAAIFAFIGVGSAYHFKFPPKDYGIFLTHHKIGTAVLARWFKLLFTGWTKERVFIDSDDLGQLDSLVEIVSYRTKYVLVILTRDTLRHDTCAGEIAAAHFKGVKMVLVACEDYVSPSDAFIGQLETHFSEQQKAVLAQKGVEVSHIKEAYEWIRKQTLIELRRERPVEEQQQVVRTAFETCQDVSNIGTAVLTSMGSAVQGLRNSLSLTDFGKGVVATTNPTPAFHGGQRCPACPG